MSCKSVKRKKIIFFTDKQTTFNQTGQTRLKNNYV